MSSPRRMRSTTSRFLSAVQRWPWANSHDPPCPVRTPSAYGLPPSPLAYLTPYLLTIHIP